MKTIRAKDLQLPKQVPVDDCFGICLNDPDLNEVYCGFKAAVEALLKSRNITAIHVDYTVIENHAPFAVVSV